MFKFVWSNTSEVTDNIMCTLYIITLFLHALEMKFTNIYLMTFMEMWIQTLMSIAITTCTYQMFISASLFVSEYILLNWTMWTSSRWLFWKEIFANHYKHIHHKHGHFFIYTYIGIQIQYVPVTWNCWLVEKIMYHLMMALWAETCSE
jgi:hypothetical protein